MVTKKKKISTKLVLFVFSVSFLLIIGSFGYFYFTGKSYIQNSAINELSGQYNNFNKASIDQIEEYNNEIAGSFFNYKINEEESKLRISNFLNYNKYVIDEFYILNRIKNESTLILPIIVFSGELVININNFAADKYYALQKSITQIHQFDDASKFGYVIKNSESNYYLQKDFGEFCLITKFSRINLFLRIIERIYHPNNINFHLVNKRNVIEFSTNIFWVNQKVEKYLDGDLVDNNFFNYGNENLIYGEWKSNIFNSKIIITNNIEKFKNDFEGIIYNLLTYSIFIFLIIVVTTLIYTNRISKSLSKISKVSISVGKGNFNEKIELSRNDELGLLINSFNQMVDNLKESYEQINFTNKELENKINELVKTKTELTKKEKLALIGETISKISHEIQNKISGVSVWVQNLEMQSALDENALMYLAEIKRSLNSFIEMLLNFKKFYRKPYLEKTNFCMQKTISKIIEDYKKVFDAKKIEIKTNISENEIEMFADKTLIEEVIVNLLVNAIYFSPENSIIKITVTIALNNLKFCIEDEGEGISDDDLDNIFNPFFTTKSSGSGLGLAISKNIIEAHNGTIEAENIIPKGTRLKIILPIKSKIK